MPHFAYRILPPRANFTATATSDELQTMGAHFRYLNKLHDAGRVVFVGRTENGDWGLAVLDAPSEAAGRALAEADPAVSSGLMRCEFNPFHTVFIRAS